MSQSRSEHRRNVESDRETDSEQLAVDPRAAGNRAPAWAENRADLIGSLPYFRQAQQGVYQNGMIIHGALIDGYGGEHTYFDDDLIITKLDGGGDSSIIAYQRHASARLTAAQATRERGRSVGIILGSKAGNAGPIKIEPAKPCRYTVLGEYIITDIWFEKQGEKQNTVTMIRYQRKNFEQPPWWQASSRTWEPTSEVRHHFSYRQCGSCREVTPKRYSIWFCANIECAEFSTPYGDPLPDDLRFSKRYLHLRTASADNSLDLSPNRLTKPTLLQDMRKGSVCQRCNKCVPRYYWDRWICEGNFGCGRLVPLPVMIPDLSTLIGEKLKVFAQPKHPFWILGDIESEPTSEFYLNGIRYREYSHPMPGGGKVTFLRSKPPKTTPGSIFDDLFQSITWGANQTGEINLIRHPIQSRTTGSRINRFEALYAPTEDKTASPPVESFDEAPVAVQAVLNYFTEILAYTDESPDDEAEEEGDPQTPTQIILTAYAGGEQKETFKPATTHNNAKSQTAITLCLGSPVRLRWRYNSKTYNHYDNDNGIPLDGDPLEDTKHYYAIQELNEQEGLSVRQYENRKRNIFRSSPRDKFAPTYLSTDLGHGDLLITRGGEEIAEHFEMAIEPHGSLHLRLTMFIGKEKEEEPAPKVIKKRVGRKRRVREETESDSAAAEELDTRSRPKRVVKKRLPKKRVGGNSKAGPSKKAKSKIREGGNSKVGPSTKLKTKRELKPLPRAKRQSRKGKEVEVPYELPRGRDPEPEPEPAEPEPEPEAESEVEPEAEQEAEPEPESTENTQRGVNWADENFIPSDPEEEEIVTSQRNARGWCSVMVAGVDGKGNKGKKRGAGETAEDEGGWKGVRRKKRVIYGRVGRRCREV